MPSSFTQQDAIANADRFWLKVNKTDSCWLWTGIQKTKSGYGAFYYDGRQRFAHRFSWLLHFGDPEDKWVRNRCGQNACVNPEHLFLGGRTDSHGGRHWNKTFPREYHSWSGAIARCEDPKSNRFYAYGARGIKMCDHWRHSFANFYADMGPCPSGLTLDRKDTNGNYEPGNCRWVTQTEQMRNKRNNRLLTLDGQTQTMQAWSEQLNINQSTLWQRLSRGWSTKKALLKPVAELHR